MEQYLPHLHMHQNHLWKSPKKYNSGHIFRGTHKHRNINTLLEKQDVSLHILLLRKSLRVRDTPNHVDGKVI